MTKPSISAIVVNWNHGHLLPGCLDALLAQGYAPLEILVVDNASRDSSAEYLAKHAPALRFHLFPENRGFCHAFNWGIRHTRSDLVLSLNPDTTIEEGFLREMVEVVGQAEERGESAGMVAPKLLQAGSPDLLDSTGLFIDRQRRPYDRGQGQPDRGQYDALPYTYGACGAAALYRRSMLQDLAPDGQVFDEVFFAYYEDADLAWRAQLRGWHCLYAPRAVATHARGGGDSLRQRGRAAKDATGPRLALRNRYLMTAKNDTAGHFLSDLPRILAAEIPRLAYTAVTRPAVLLGLYDLVRALLAARQKRRRNRQRQTVDDARIRRWFTAPADLAAGRQERAR